MFHLVSKGIYCLILLIYVIWHDWKLNLKIHHGFIHNFHMTFFCWYVELMKTPKISNLPQHIILETLHHCPSLFSFLSPFPGPFLNFFFFCVSSKLLAKVIPFTIHMIHVIITICPCPLQWKKSWASSMHVEAFHLLGIIFVHNTFWLFLISFQQFSSIAYSIIMFIAISKLG